MIFSFTLFITEYNSLHMFFFLNYYCLIFMENKCNAPKPDM